MVYWIWCSGEQQSWANKGVEEYSEKDENTNGGVNLNMSKHTGYVNAGANLKEA